MSNGGMLVWRRRFSRNNWTAFRSRTSELPLIPIENDESITSWPVFIWTLAGIGMRLNCRVSAAEKDKKAGHNTRIGKITRTKCSPKLRRGRGRIVELRAARKLAKKSLE